MNSSESENKMVLGENKVVHYALQLLALSLLLIMCFRIIEPFLTLLIWGSVLAIALYPVYKGLSKKLKGRNALPAVLITVLNLVIIIGPAAWLLFATVREVAELGSAYRSGQFSIPAPAEKIKDWPVIGSTVFKYWTDASNNLGALIVEHRDQVKSVLLKALELLSSTAQGILLLAGSIIIAGVLLAYAKPAAAFARALLVHLTGKAGNALTDSAELTVRSVVKGILGVAVIQAMLAGIGFVVAGIPLAGLWTLVCLILAIVQVGLLPVSLGVIIYIWSEGTTTTAVLLTIWMVLVGIVDNILKPILLGQGAPAPWW